MVYGLEFWYSSDLHYRLYVSIVFVILSIWNVGVM